MGIKDDGAFKRSWFVLTDEAYKFGEIAEDYGYPISRYDGVTIGLNDWGTESLQGITGFRISAIRRELADLLRDFKEAYPDAHIIVMRS